MDVRLESSPREVRGMNSQELRQSFLVEDLMVEDKVQLVYTHYDRMIIGGAKPTTNALTLNTHEELKAAFFLERRELGIINVGGEGAVKAEGEHYSLQKLDALYLGKGTREVSFTSKDKDNPALFYLLSAPAHKEYPNRKLSKEEASPTTVGERSTANRRTIYKYIHLEGIQSCQLVMGLTILEEGSVWNTMPAHTHSRRMEVYFYFDVPGEGRVFHLMGEPTQTRHILTANHQALISPPWSIHSGCGTSAYGFIWGMGGENKNYTDMDPAPLRDMR